MDFGTVEQNQPSDPRVITITNTGTENLALTGLNLPIGVTVTHDCHAWLKTGESCRVTAVLKPMTRGSKTRAFVVDTTSGQASVPMEAKVDRYMTDAKKTSNIQEYNSAIMEAPVN